MSCYFRSRRNNFVKRNWGIVAACSIFLVLAPLSAPAQDRPPAPDNSKVNKDDGVTADQAKNNLTDRELIQKIRKSLVEDKSLSTYAHNVKVIADHGRVTLKGPVTSEDEKRAVERMASEVAGEGNVTGEITIKAARAKRS